MTFTKINTPYDSVITVGDETSWIKLSVTSKGQCDPHFELKSSNSKYSTMLIPYSFLTDTYDERMATNSFHHHSLEETTTITRKGVVWEVTQSWGEETVTTEISHNDMISLLKHCSNYFKIQRSFKKEFKIHWTVKVYKQLTKIYNLPLKLVKW